MEREERVAGSDPATSPSAAPSLGATLLHVAWLAILLGLGMEVLLLLVTGFGNFLGPKSFVADTLKSVSWSVIVCAGLALGTTISKAQIPVMGFLGLLAAPLALEVSRVFHKGATEALTITDTAPVVASPVLLALLKGVEYGCLGLAVAWLSQRPWGGAMAYVAVGFVVGVLFGSATLALTYQAAPELFSTADLISRGLNEIIFPVGCSLVLFSAGAIAERTAKQDQP